MIFPLQYYLVRWFSKPAGCPIRCLNTVQISYLDTPGQLLGQIQLFQSSQGFFWPSRWAPCWCPEHRPPEGRRTGVYAEIKQTVMPLGCLCFAQKMQCSYLSRCQWHHLFSLSLLLSYSGSSFFQHYLPTILRIAFPILMFIRNNENDKLQRERKFSYKHYAKKSLIHIRKVTLRNVSLRK